MGHPDQVTPFLGIALSPPIRRPIFSMRTQIRTATPMMPTTISHDIRSRPSAFPRIFAAMLLTIFARPAEAQNQSSLLLVDDSNPINTLLAGSDSHAAFAQEVTNFDELFAFCQNTPLIAGVPDTPTLIDDPDADSLLSIGVSERTRIEPRAFNPVLTSAIYGHDCPRSTIEQNAFETSESERAMNLDGAIVWNANNGVNLYGSTSWTDFRRNAAVSEYLTPTAGIAWRLENGTNISLGVEVDYANSFERQGISASFTFAF